jgi:hypothetical protein
MPNHVGYIIYHNVDPEHQENERNCHLISTYFNFPESVNITYTYKYSADEYEVGIASQSYSDTLSRLSVIEKFITSKNSTVLKIYILGPPCWDPPEDQDSPEDQD